HPLVTRTSSFVLRTSVVPSSHSPHPASSILHYVLPIIPPIRTPRHVQICKVRYTPVTITPQIRNPPLPPFFAQSSMLRQNPCPVPVFGAFHMPNQNHTNR